MARPAKSLVVEETVNPAEFNSNTVIVVQVPVKAEVMAKYQEQALSRGGSTSTLMGERLTSCVDHLDPQGLFFGGELREQLEGILRDNLPTERDTIRLLKEALSIDVSGVRVELSAPQIRRLELGLARNQSISDRITTMVQRAATATTGTR